MVTDSAATRLFPIGHCIGAYHDAVGSPAQFFQVRIGPDVVPLSNEQFAIWGLAHGLADREIGKPWNAERVIEAGVAAGLPDPGRVVVELIGERVLVETTDGSDSAVTFARQHRMLPLMLGLGNSADEPRVYAAGIIGQPIVLMSSMIYDLFQWAHMDPDLWSACTGAAETAQRAGVADENAKDPHRLLDILLGSLHTLLSPNAVCLDARVED